MSVRCRAYLHSDCWENHKKRQWLHRQTQHYCQIIHCCASTTMVGPRPAYGLFCIATRLLEVSLHCALTSCGAVYCNRSCLWVCVFATGGRGRAGGRAGGRCPNLTTASARSVCVSLSAFFLKGLQLKCSYAVDVLTGIIRILLTSNRELETHFIVVALVGCFPPAQIRSSVDQLYSIPAQQTRSRLVVLHATPTVLQTWWRGRIVRWVTWRNCTVTPRSIRHAVRCTLELDRRVDSEHNSPRCKHDLLYTELTELKCNILFLMNDSIFRILPFYGVAALL